MFLDGLTLLDLDNSRSNSPQESIPAKPNDCSDDFSANKLSTGTRVAQNIVFCVHLAPWETFEQGHVIVGKISTQQLKSSIIEITVQFFICFQNLKTLCARQDKLKHYAFNLPVFCSCLTTASGQQASIAVAGLGRKGLAGAGGKTNKQKTLPLWIQGLGEGGGRNQTIGVFTSQTSSPRLAWRFWGASPHWDSP